MYAGDAGRHAAGGDLQPYLLPLAEAQYDILLVGIPVSMRDLSPHREKLVKACAMSDNVLLALPCHAQVQRRSPEARRRRLPAC